MNDISYRLYYKDNKVKESLMLILNETDKDFIPALSSKYEIDKVVDKYIALAHNLVAFVDGVPAGLVSFYPNKKPENSYLSLICVRERYRGLRLGKTLELKCIEHCRDFGSDGVLLNMRKSNTSLYNSRIKMGYEVQGEYESSISDEVIVDLYLRF